MDENIDHLVDGLRDASAMFTKECADGNWAEAQAALLELCRCIGRIRASVQNLSLLDEQNRERTIAFLRKSVDTLGGNQKIFPYLAHFSGIQKNFAKHAASAVHARYLEALGNTDEELDSVKPTLRVHKPAD
jgi:hypothetical protein